MGKMPPAFLAAIERRNATNKGKKKKPVKGNPFAKGAPSDNDGDEGKK